MFRSFHINGNRPGKKGSAKRVLYAGNSERHHCFRRRFPSVSEGQGTRAEIEGRREKELLRIQSEAYQKAQEIMGKADAEATRIYADAYNRDPEFYSFTNTLENYRNTLKENGKLIISTDSDFFKYISRYGIREGIMNVHEINGIALM